jgi:hypothetical protein
MKKELKLFVWNDFCPDYTSGIAFAIASTEDEARRLIVKECKCEPYTWGTLSKHRLGRKFADCVFGGG